MKIAMTKKAKLAMLVGAGASVILAATAAYAAVTSASGSGWNQAAACQSAKNNAAVQARGTVQGYSNCMCSDSGYDGHHRWTCTVDAYYTED